MLARNNTLVEVEQWFINAFYPLTSRAVIIKAFGMNCLYNSFTHGHLWHTSVWACMEVATLKPWLEKESNNTLISLKIEMLRITLFVYRSICWTYTFLSLLNYDLIPGKMKIDHIFCWLSLYFPRKNFVHKELNNESETWNLCKLLNKNLKWVNENENESIPPEKIINSHEA